MVYWNYRPFCWPHLLYTLFLKIRNTSFVICQISVFTWIYFWTWYILFHWFISPFYASSTLFYLLLLCVVLYLVEWVSPYRSYFFKKIFTVIEHFIFLVNFNINLCGFMKILLTFFFWCCFFSLLTWLISLQFWD